MEITRLYVFNRKGPRIRKRNMAPFIVTGCVSCTPASGRCSVTFRRKSMLELQKMKLWTWTKYFPTPPFTYITKQFPIVEEKIKYIFNLCEEVSGLKNVRMAQHRVTEASNILTALQHQRRETSAALSEIQCKIKQIHTELRIISRGEDRYLQLITEEIKILKEEKILKARLNEAELQEKDQFTVLLRAVEKSHNEERLQTKKIQIFSLIASGLSALLGFIGAMIKNHSKNSKMTESILHARPGLTEESKKYLDYIANMKISNNDVLYDLIYVMNKRVMIMEQEMRELRTFIIVTSLVCVIMQLCRYCFSG